MKFFVMPYSEAFSALATVEIYVALWCSAVGSNFNFFFDGHVTNFTVSLGVTKKQVYGLSEILIYFEEVGMV